MIFLSQLVLGAAQGSGDGAVIKLGKSSIKLRSSTVLLCCYHEPHRDRLTMEEIIKLYHKDLGTRLAEVRDVFVFCCFTSFSYMDVYKLSTHHIVTGIYDTYILYRFVPHVFNGRILF